MPGWIAWLVRRVCSDERVEDVLGDLEELHGRRRKRLGSIAWFGAIAWLGTFVDLGRFVFTLAISHLGEWLRTAGSAAVVFELKLALRLLRKQPLLNLVALFALATGIGLANLGVTFADASFFSDLPYHNGDRFVRVEVHDAISGQRVRGLPHDLVRLLQDEATTLDLLAGKDHEQLNLFAPNGEVDTVTGVVMSPMAFEHLPARPILGRVLEIGDDEPTAPPVVVIRESLWRSRFGTRSSILGEALDVGGTPRTIVGVLPDTFEFPNSPQLWVPLDRPTWSGTSDTTGLGIELFAVLADGTTLAKARAELSTLGARFDSAHGADRPLRLRAVPYTEPWDPAGTAAAMALFLFVLALVLLVIAAQVGHLFLVRTSSRASELALRSALGAGRPQLVAQLGGEVAVLVALASVVGFVASNRFLTWIRRSLDEAPFWLVLDPSLRTLGLLFGFSLLTAWAAGLAPALRATAVNQDEALRSGGRGVSRPLWGRFGSTVTVLETALSVALVGAALVVGRGAAAHFAPEVPLPDGEVLTAHLRFERPIPPEGFGGDSGAWAEEQLRDVRRATLEALEALPGVVAVGSISALPGEPSHRWRTELEADPVAEFPPPSFRAPAAAVLPGALEALGAKARSGRLFEPRDLLPEALPVVVVDQGFVDLHFAGRNPIGRRLRLLPDSGDESVGPWREIVGVVPELGLDIVDPGRNGGFYLPMGVSRSLDLLVRVEGDPATYAGPIRRAVGAVASTTTLRRVQPLEDVARETAFALSALGGSLVSLGLSALLLAWLGMFAVTSLGVVQRTREIGVRVALGASRSQVLALLSRRALGQMALGSVLGAVVAMLVIEMVRRVEPGIGPGGGRDLVLVALCFAVGALLACWLPARRALRIRPAEALSAD